MVGEFIISCGSTVCWVPFKRSNIIRIREKVNLSRSKGCKVILKKQSCKSIIIWPFYGIMVSDRISGCNAPIGFIDALIFLRSVRRCHLLDFFFFFNDKNRRVPRRTRFLYML